MPDPVIRPAVAHDYEAVAELELQHSQSHPLWERSYLEDLDRYTVAVQDGQVLGICRGHHASGAWQNCEVSPEPPEEWTCSFIDPLVVDEAHRGRGLGPVLLGDFMKRAAEAGSTWLVLTPVQGEPLGPTEQMRRFYGRAGLFLLEPAEEHDRRHPWMMGSPLVEHPQYAIHPATHDPAADSSPKPLVRPGRSAGSYAFEDRLRRQLGAAPRQGTTGR